jgi:hypothetical protein
MQQSPELHHDSMCVQTTEKIRHQISIRRHPRVGCRDGLFTLKSLLNTQHNHDLPSYVGFIDLVKAYDTANHKMLLLVLEKYGAPPKFVSAVEKMYENNNIILKIEKEQVEMTQTIGVRQGDKWFPSSSYS